MLYDNTTIQGRWIHVDNNNMTVLSKKFSTDDYDRIVTNVTMAMPHAGVFAAARDPLNGLMQPQDLNVSILISCEQVHVADMTAGSWRIRHRSICPISNYKCPLRQYATRRAWADRLFTMAHGKRVSHECHRMAGWFWYTTWPSWLNETPVDDLFGFGEKYGRRHPVFSKLPRPYNTVLNTTGWFTDSIYMLATSATGNYTMCSMKASMTTQCSTQYHASLSGGTMNAQCEDAKNDLAYGKSYANATDGVVQKDWAAVAAEWGMALSLNAGITDGAASNARLLSQLIPTQQALDPSLPSMAEALAVLSGCTLLLSTTGSPFIHFWNYSTTVSELAEPQPQGFRATLRTRDYASGGTQRWQGIFYIILFLTFATNIFCLVYFLVRHGS